MAGELTPFGKLTKWLLIPGVLAAAGYFVVGPAIGKDALKKIKVPAGVQKIVQDAVAPDGKAKGEDNAPRTSSGPEVEVAVTPTRSESGTRVAQREPEREEAPKPRRKRRKKKRVTQPAAQKPTEAPPVQSEPPPVDEGGSAGSTTAG